MSRDRPRSPDNRVRPTEGAGTTAISTPATPCSSAGLALWGALGGILYAVLFIIGTILLFDGRPDGDASPAKVIAHYSDSGHRDKINIGWIISGFGVFFFLGFLSTLR